MIRVIIFLGLLGGFIWFTPARSAVKEGLAQTQHAMSTTVIADSTLTEHWNDLRTTVTEKFNAFLRDKLHKAVDEMVQ
jgi:hypothetical protein